MQRTLLHRRVATEDYRALEELARSSREQATRAQIILAVVDGACPATLARQHGLPRTTVYSWLRRFASSGVASLDSPNREHQLLRFR